MAKPRDPSSLPDGRTYSLLGNGTSQPNPRSAPRTPQGLLSYIEALNREANDNLPPSAPRHAPILEQVSTPATTPASTSLDEAHRAENRWPVIGAENERARRQSILENSPALFPIEENPRASGAAPSHRVSSLGAELVQKHDQEIEEEAARVGADPDLLRAVMYVEVSQGWYGYPFELPHIADSILPMNVRGSLWRTLLPEGQPGLRPVRGAGRVPAHLGDDSRYVLDNPRLNIRAGALLLKRIQDRLADPSVRNTATLYNSLGQSNITDYGAQVEQAYRNRYWEQAGAAPTNTSMGRGPRLK
jgi:soluble lytic murein transglycosylase-like protein